MRSNYWKEKSTHFLSQKMFLEKITFELNEKSLKIIHQQLFRGKRERFLRLDEIGHKYEVQQSSTITSNFLTIFFIISISLLIPSFSLLINTSWFFLFVFSLFFIPILLGILSHEKVILLQAKAEPIIFFWSKKNRKDVEMFVNDIIQHSKNFLIWKYGKPDKDLPKEKQMDSVKWLRDNLIISDEVYQNLKQQLNQLFEEENKPDD